MLPVVVHRAICYETQLALHHRKVVVKPQRKKWLITTASEQALPVAVSSEQRKIRTCGSTKRMFPAEKCYQQIRMPADAISQSVPKLGKA